MAYRLGWLLYWICVGLAALWAAVAVLVAMQDPQMHQNSWPIFLLVLLSFAGLPALFVYGLGRAFRYVLAGD